MGLLDKLFANDLQQRLGELRPRLHRTATAWCGSKQQADDLVQEAMFKAWSRRRQLKDAKALDAWVFSILANCFRDHCRGRSDFGELAERPDQQRSAEDEAIAGQTVLRVRRAIGRLAQGQREVLMLVDLEGFSYAEVSEILGVPMGTVMSRLNRARQRLKLLLAAPQGASAGHLERVK